MSHSNGSEQPSVNALLECLKKMIALEGQGILYIVVDALDECPNSFVLHTGRERVLDILKELIGLKLPNLRICVTSQPIVEIREVLEPLKPCVVSLQDQDGQQKDVAQYASFVVRSEVRLRKWPEKVKVSAVDAVAKNGGGMYVTRI
jgi:hypothetical protein